MKKVTLKTAHKQDFFRRGEALVLLAGADHAMPEECALRFEDPADLLRLLTPRRLELVSSLKGAPGSVTVFVGRWQRNSSAFKGDRSWIRV
jgi:predicted transcriptional regulator